MVTLANEIGNDPVLLPLLDIFDSQCSQFRATQTSAQQNGERCVVSFAAKTANVYSSQKTLTLLRGKPIANRHAQPFGALHAANACRQVGAQEPAIRGLIRKPPDCRESQIYCRGRIVLLFERNPVTGDYGLLKASLGSEQYHSMNSLIAWS